MATWTFAASTRPPDWVGAWAMAPMGAGADTTHVQGTGFDNQTVRNIVHLAAGGQAVRFELSNTFGDTALEIGAATVAVTTAGGAIAPQTLRTATFSGDSQVVVAPDTCVMSDPIELAIEPGDGLAISIYLPVPTGKTTWHTNTQSTSYISAEGDHSRDVADAAFGETISKFYLTEVDVRGSRTQGTVVAFGDSLTEGFPSTTDAHHRYPDFLQARMLSGPPDRRLTVINEGIGGNRLLTDVWDDDRSHESGQNRLDRDVLARTSVRAMVLLFGTNDLIHGNADGEPTTAGDLVGATKSILDRAHAHRVRVTVGTVPPLGGSSFYLERVEQNRQDFNAWVRLGGEPDGVADFDGALRDPDVPMRIAEGMHSGDHVHPSDDGYRAMADIIDLRQLEGVAGLPGGAEG